MAHYGFVHRFGQNAVLKRFRGFITLRNSESLQRVLASEFLGMTNQASVERMISALTTFMANYITWLALQANWAKQPSPHK